MLLTVVIYVLLGYEDNNMWFGCVSSVIMERPLLALSSQMRFAIFLRYTLNCLDAFKDWDAACFQSKLFPWGCVGKCSHAENRQSHNALCGCRCCRWSELRSDLYLCICRRIHMWRFVWTILLRTAVSTLEACLLRASSRHPPVADKECWWK